MKSLALHAIRFYQRFLSSHKGFRCAYAAVTGHASCSMLGYRAIRRFGLWRGLGVLDDRLHRCGSAYQRHRAGRSAGRGGPLFHQTGSFSCDLPCDAGDTCDVCDCAFDWWRRKRRHDRQALRPSRGQRQRAPDRS